ncbi:unnamed protein product [Allacma fusca]|uniref:O-acyltransferase WSD1 C-terminal domain-containing protein n=1 Tax=Allacma fusca TaxID=39272 RepID=A0A8J2KPH0_9HEXA|nr:unnamed protein product [Allacma fusca]
MTFIRKLSNFLTELIFILVAVLSFPSFLLLPLFILPFYIYRTIIKCLSKTLNLKAAKIMTLRNSVVANDNLYTRPEQTVVISIGFKGRLDYQITLDMATAHFDKRNDKNELLFPEFKQYYSSWGGYLFWKNDDSFEMSNHIRKYEGKSSTVSYEELKEFCLELPRKPYTRKRSPWEVLVVNDFQHDEFPGEELSVLILRVHHGLGDGFSILESFTSAVGMWENIKEKLPLPIYSSGAVNPSFWYYLWMFLSSPYHSLKQGPGSYDINAFRIKGKNLQKKLRTGHLKYELDFIKGNCKKWGVTFSGFVFAAVCGGFRNFMLENDMKVPEYFHVGMPFPWPGRNSSKVQNRMCVCIMKFPVGTALLEERVQLTDEIWKKLKKSPAPLMNWTFMPIFGLLPGFLVKMFIRNNFTTAVLSNFPGPEDKIELRSAGEPCLTEDIEFVTGLWRGNCGVGIGILSAHGILKVNIGVDEAILEQTQVDALKSHIEKEFKILTNHSGVFNCEV